MWLDGYSVYQDEMPEEWPSPLPSLFPSPSMSLCIFSSIFWLFLLFFFPHCEQLTAVSLKSRRVSWVVLSLLTQRALHRRSFSFFFFPFFFLPRRREDGGAPRGGRPDAASLLLFMMRLLFEFNVFYYIHHSHVFPQRPLLSLIGGGVFYLYIFYLFILFALPFTLLFFSFYIFYYYC